MAAMFITLQRAKPQKAIQIMWTLPPNMGMPAAASLSASATPKAWIMSLLAGVNGAKASWVAKRYQMDTFSAPNAARIRQFRNDKTLFAPDIVSSPGTALVWGLS